MRGESLRRSRACAGRSKRPRGPIPDFVSVSAALVEAELRLVLGEPERAWTVLAELETDGDAPDLAVGIAALELASGRIPTPPLESVDAYLASERPLGASVHRRSRHA